MKTKKRMKQFLSWLLVMGLIFTNMLSASIAKAETPVQSEETGETVADAYAIYPIPQNITYTEGEFTLSDKVVIVADEGVDVYTTNFLKKILENYDVAYETAETVQAGKTNIVLSVQGTAGVAATYVTENITISDEDLFTKNDAYVLDAKDGMIVIQGKDADSVYYGVATLQMMFSSFDGAKFLNAHIEDFATVAVRGYIEGFYGAWDFEERENLMRFAGNYKMNSYVYAAKGDAYHTNKWAELYPADMIKEFKNLVEVGKETKVQFGWSVHMGSFFSGLSDADVTEGAETEKFLNKYNQLIAKFQQLYDVGVRKFDVLNDDFGSGTHTMVVKVLNRINRDLKAMGCESIVYCPQGYNEAWSKWDSTINELPALRELDEDIAIYWTGADVNAPITQSTVDYVTGKSNHAPDYWLNYPVNEHAKSGIFLGDITYYARDGVTGLAGFHSNPSRYAYANEVGLYQLAALVWNNNNYSAHAQEVWASAFDYLQPEVKDSYYTIAKNIANAPNSGRVPGFNESEYLKERLEKVQALVKNGEAIKSNAEAQEIYAEFKNILSAIADFRANCANQDLVAELDPWLKSLSDIATAGRDALDGLFAMEDGDASRGWEKLSSASKAYDSAYTYLACPQDPSMNNNFAKAGSKRLYPFVTQLINTVNKRLTPIINPNAVIPTLFAKVGGKEIEEDNNARKMYDGDETTCTTWNTVQKAGDYYGFDFGKVITVRDISILQGTTDADHDIFHKAVLQYSTDNETWTDIEATVELDGHKIFVEGLDIKARYVRYYLKETGTASKPDYWTHVREFTVNKKVEERDKVYTNVESLKETPLSISGAKISIRNLQDLTLQPGEYIGIKLVSPVAVTGFVKILDNADGLILEYSYNEQDWTEALAVENPVGVKYLRLRNKSDVAVTTNLKKIEMLVKHLEAEPKLFTTTNFREGKVENIFDGDLATHVLTDSSQTKDTFITFDLGKMLEVYDVTLVTTDGEQRFYDAKIQVSKDNINWTDIGVVENDNSVFEVPYRYVNCDGEGTQARYLRIYFTEGSSNQLKLQEIQINKNVEGIGAIKEITSSMNGNIKAAVDNDISTLFAASATTGDYIEYRISANTNVEQVSILQGAAGIGKAFAVTAKGNVKLGVLSQSVNTFDTTEIAPITAIRIEWDGEEEVAIHEISLGKGTDKSEDIGIYVEPIIYGAVKEVTNIALGKEVTVSGTSDGNKDNVNDGDINTKWDSNDIKTIEADSWVAIKLGEKVYEVSQVVVSYFNKIYPTSYEVQVSDDGVNWTSVKTLTKDNNGPTYPVDTITFETPVTAKHVRIYFYSLNTAAAGAGVGVREFEIYGTEKKYDTEGITNIAPGKEVTVSGTSDGNKDNVNDGDTNTKWDSNFIKNGQTDIGDSWISINLGERVCEVSQLVVSYFNKIYPTNYEVQISDKVQVSHDNDDDWTTVKTLTKDNNGPTYPVDTITFETPVTARHVRLYFYSLNTVAGGNGVGITEFEIYGKPISDNLQEEEEEVEVSGITISAEQLQLAIGEKATLTATVNPENATYKNVYWSSSKEARATVKNGEITALKGGKVIITAATVNGLTATCEVIIPCAHTAPTELRGEKEPTCTEAGYTGDTVCSDCDTVMEQGKEVAATGHAADDWETQKEATCKETGSKAKKCKVCQTVFETEVIPVKAHTPGAWEVTKSASCEVAGTNVQKCTVCGEIVKTEAIAATGHISDTGVITKAPTTAATGTKTYSCTVCKKVIRTEVLAKVEKPNEPQKPKLPKKGARIVIKGVTYKVTKSHAKNGTVAFVKGKSNSKTITVPATIKKDGIIYKVTSIEKEAFNNQKKLTKVTIGSNVSKIGANVFKNCNKLKTIKITSKKLTAKGVNKTAFKSVKKSVTIQVPSAKLKTYQKMFKTKGLNSKVKIKK